MKLVILAATAALMAAGAGQAIAQSSNANISAAPGSFEERKGLQDYGQRRDIEGARAQRIEGNPLEIKEAGALIKAAGAACEAVDARPISHSRTADTYEVACKGELGWVVTGKDGKASAFDCLQLLAVSRASVDPRARPAVCRLSMNGRPETGLEPLLKRAGVTACQATKANYLGSGGQPPIARYEVLCTEGGYLLDAPTLGSTAALQAVPCAKAAEIGAACALKR